MIQNGLSTNCKDHACATITSETSRGIGIEKEAISEALALLIEDAGIIIYTIEKDF
jgi:hypothetical protein